MLAKGAPPQSQSPVEFNSACTRPAPSDPRDRSLTASTALRRLRSWAFSAATSPLRLPARHSSGLLLPSSSSYLAAALGGDTASCENSPYSWARWWRC